MGVDFDVIGKIRMGDQLLTQRAFRSGPQAKADKMLQRRECSDVPGGKADITRIYRYVR
jgi:hypothetical protein